MLFGKKKRRITRLLVVEDEPLIAFDNEHVLSEAQYEIVATVDRVAQAVAVLQSDASVDLVLVDVNLADGSGLDVARAAAEAGVAVLFVTGQCPAEAMTLAAGCLSKPYQQRDLVTAIGVIDATLDGRRPKKLPAGLRLFASREG